MRHAHHRQASVAQLVGAGPVEEGSPQSTISEREHRHGLGPDEVLIGEEVQHGNVLVDGHDGKVVGLAQLSRAGGGHGGGHSGGSGGVGESTISHFFFFLFIFLQQQQRAGLRAYTVVAISCDTASRPKEQAAGANHNTHPTP